MAAGTGEKRPTSRAATTPSRIPTIPPLTVRATASSRNWRSTSRVRAPTALRRPISRVRSDTLTSMMFITPTPPTSSEIPAIEASTRVRMPRMRPTTPRMSSWVRTSYSCSGWALATTSRMMRRSSSICPVLGALTAIPSTRLIPNSRCAAVTGTNTSASRLTPKAVPTRVSTPTTRKRTPPTVIDLPTGSRPGNRASAGSAPSTATLRRVSTSEAVKNPPRASERSNTSGMVSLVPCTLTLVRRVPTIATSPEATVVATRRGSPSASPTRRASSSRNRETLGAVPNSRVPGATNRMLEPSEPTAEVTSLRAPVPMATSRTTLITPMTTPSMVSPERSLLARSASHATLAASASLMGHPLGWGRATVVEEHPAVEVGRHPGVVRDHHHRHATLVVQAGEQPDHLLAGARVEVAGGLVGQQHRGLGDQRPGDRHPLLLAAGQPGDVPALERERAAGRPVQAAEQPQQGRLARPARPHDRQRVPLRNDQIDPVKCPHLDPVKAVHLGNADRLH